MIDIGLNPQTTGLTTALNYFVRRLGVPDTEAMYQAIANADGGGNDDAWWED